MILYRLTRIGQNKTWSLRVILDVMSFLGWSLYAEVAVDVFICKRLQDSASSSSFCSKFRGLYRVFVLCFAVFFVFYLGCFILLCVFICFLGLCFLYYFLCICVFVICFCLFIFLLFSVFMHFILCCYLVFSAFFLFSCIFCLFVCLFSCFVSCFFMHYVINNTH